MISVNTEITDARAVAPTALRCWILFDSACPFCLRCVAAAKPILAPRGFAFLPLQTPWVRSFFAMPDAELLSEMRLLLPDRQSFGGADAILEIAKHVWWAWPFAAIAHIPGVRPILRAAYRAIAARRSCTAGACQVSSYSKSVQAGSQT